MLTSTPAIHGAIEELEARAREFETRAGECRETAATLRRLYQVSTIVGEAVAKDPLPAPAAPRRLTPPRETTKPRKSGPLSTTGVPDRAALATRVLQIVTEAGEPIRSGRIKATLGKRVEIQWLRRALRELVQQGVLTRTGEKATTAYTVKVSRRRPTLPSSASVGPTPKPAPGPVAVPPRSDATKSTADQRAERVSTWLMTGPFAGDQRFRVADLSPMLRGAFPDGSYSELHRAIDKLVVDQKLGIQFEGTDKFYRRRP